MVPSIFTETPIEGALLAWGLQIQVALGLGLAGVVAVKSLMLIPSFWTFVKSTTGISTGLGHPASHATNMILKLCSVIFAFAAMTVSSGNIPISSPEGKEWKNYAGVANSSDSDLRRLTGSNDGLLVYSLAHGAISGVSEFITDIIDSSLSSSKFVKDPGFFMETLARTAGKAMGSFGAGTTRALDQLAENCQNTSNPRVLGPARELKDAFDLSTPECQTLWNNFQIEYEKMGRVVETIYGSRELATLGEEVLPNGSTMRDVAVNKARSDFILRYMQDKAGRTRLGTSTEMRDVTFSDSSDTLIEDVGRNGILSAGYIKLMSHFTDIEGDLLKAEAANNFRKVASLIPAARGWIFMILAAGFPIVALLGGFSFWKPFFGWLVATTMLCLYQPLALASFRIVEILHRKASFAMGLDLVSKDPLSFTGLQILASEMSRIESVYLYSQVGLFSALVIGSLLSFTKLDSMVTGRAGRLFGDSISSLRGAGFMHRNMKVDLGNERGGAMNVAGRRVVGSSAGAMGGGADGGMVPTVRGPIAPNGSGGAGVWARGFAYRRLSEGGDGAVVPVTPQPPNGGGRGGASASVSMPSSRAPIHARQLAPLLLPAPRRLDGETV